MRDRTEAQPPRRRRWLVWVLAVLVVALGSAGVATLWLVPSPEERYLADLEQRGLDDAFASDEEAVRRARRRCDEAESGSGVAGTEAEHVGMDHLCPEHADKLRVLERHEFEGALLVMSLGEGAVDTTGESCSGTDGYEDVNATTPVVVTDADGEELARTELGPGEAPDERSCVFGFTVELTEGEERYEIIIGDRGGRTLTWEGLHEQGALSFVLGGVD